MPPRRLPCLMTQALACLALGWTAAARAQGLPLDDAALSAVHGQALLSLTNTSLNGLDFSRITLGADIQFSANLSQLRLGEYTQPLRNGTGADIDIGLLRFGRSDGTEAQRTVTVTDPYLEIVYRNAAAGGSAAAREVLGLRLGFGTVRGELGVALNTLSGSLRVDAGSAGVLDSRTDPLGGRRWDGTACAAGSPCTLALNQIGQLTAGDASGPSRDFFIAVLKQAVQFPALNGVASDKALEGFWLNWRDRLSGSIAAPAANLPKAPGG